MAGPRRPAARIKRDGFAQTMEAVAYTWFNRFAALRYMELHDYLGHGHRVLSSRTAGGLPEILRHAARPPARTAGPERRPSPARCSWPATRTASSTSCCWSPSATRCRGPPCPSCSSASTTRPSCCCPTTCCAPTPSSPSWLPDARRRLGKVEVIGWLYQFYISEKKDQVIGKVVKSEDIPAATQLFTPNWIVQYLVQNSVGRLWLMANPTSTLASQWPYYIQPAEQTPEVQAQLDALIQTRIREDGEQR
jgi:hypothetical protein